MAEEKKELSDVLKEMNKKYGVGAVSFVSEDDERGKIEAESTNCYSLDRVMDCGGLARGRIIELIGNPSGGKSTMALYFIAQVQKRGGVAAYIDAEFCFSSDYAKKLGVDVNKLLLSQPSSGEEALDIVENLIKSQEVGIIVVDSTAALVPEKELVGNIEDAQVAMQARLLSKGLRKITGELAKAKTILIFISQMRDKLGFSFVGPSKDSTGGNAIKFYASVRLKIDKIKMFKDKEEAVIGNRLKIEAVKNKVGRPFRSCEIDLLFSRGIDVVGDILDVAVSEGIVKKSGMTYTYGEKKLGVGRDSVKGVLENDSELLAEIKGKLPPLTSVEEKK